MCTVWVYGWVMSAGLILRFGKVGKLYRAADWPQRIGLTTKHVMSAFPAVGLTPLCDSIIQRCWPSGL